VIAEPAEFGGTRHLSAAQFVYDQRDAIVLVRLKGSGSPSSTGPKVKKW
jgi:hypothetical protein